MSRLSCKRHHGRWLAALTAELALLTATSANAWWSGGHSGWVCDPPTTYLQEYGFLDRLGPSPGDIQRLNRDQWKAMRYGGYCDPAKIALRARCPYANRRCYAYDY